MSDGQIAEHVGVSDMMVAKYRRELTPKVLESPTRTGRDGRTTNTANIGKPNPAPSLARLRPVPTSPLRVPRPGCLPWCRS